MRTLNGSPAGLLLAMLLPAVAATSEATVGPGSALNAVNTEVSAMVQMRDGVHLSTDLWYPTSIGRLADAAAKLPTILIRTPYNKREAGKDDAVQFFAAHGYLVAIQDVRGKFESEGEYRYSISDRQDGYDTLSWLAAQPWSNGKIGTYGCSYEGEVQDELAAMRHPNHAAAIIGGAADYQGGGIRDFGFIRYGALELAAAFEWNRSEGSLVYYAPPSFLDRHKWFQSDAARYFTGAPVVPPIDSMALLRSLPVVQMMRKAGAPPNDFENWVTHEPDDPWWKYQQGITESDRFNVPALHITSWYDTPFSTLEAFALFQRNAQSAQARHNQFLIVSPGTHCGSESLTEHSVVGDRELGDAHLEYKQLYLRWFDHWLKGIDNDVTRRPKVQIYVMGRNRWRSASEWPPRGVHYQKWYLHSRGNANSRSGDGLLSGVEPGPERPDRFSYDPQSPVPTHGGQICCTGGVIPEGSVDQSSVETRSDMLVYSSKRLKDGLEVTGPIEAVLWVASSAMDTDFTAKLVDVYPDGRAFNIQEGILRMRYREGYRQKLLMEPGKAYEIHLDLEATSNYFGPGHRVRLEVSSSNFPRFDRNMNTGGRNFDEVSGIRAQNAVLHSVGHASYLLLPVLE
jgi:uncharacterized protein